MNKEKAIRGLRLFEYAIGLFKEVIEEPTVEEEVNVFTKAETLEAPALTRLNDIRSGVKLGRDIKAKDVEYLLSKIDTAIEGLDIIISKGLEIKGERGLLFVTHIAEATLKQIKDDSQTT